MNTNLIQATMHCRAGCGACCIAPSITSFIPGMPQGKPAGIHCVQLSEENRCKLFGDLKRPEFCGRLKASTEMCGSNRHQAMTYLSELELLTLP